MHINKGFSMIEVLVTLVIMSIGLLGLASVQVWSVKNANNSNSRTLATFFATDMIERMRSNRVGLDNGAYDEITGDETDPACSICSPAEMADLHAYEWNQQLRDSASEGLSGAVGTVQRDGAYHVLTVSWSEEDKAAAVGNNNTNAVAAKSLTMRVRI